MAFSITFTALKGQVTYFFPQFSTFTPPPQRMNLVPLLGILRRRAQDLGEVFEPVH